MAPSIPFIFPLDSCRQKQDILSSPSVCSWWSLLGLTPICQGLTCSREPKTQHSDHSRGDLANGAYRRITLLNYTITSKVQGEVGHLRHKDTAEPCSLLCKPGHSVSFCKVTLRWVDLQPIQLLNVFILSQMQHFACAMG